MKKLLMAIIACEVILARGNKTSNSASDAATQQNLEAVHNISKAFETGDTSLINKSVAKDFIDHKDYGDV
jgi:hypothetical protein